MPGEPLTAEIIRVSADEALRAVATALINVGTPDEHARVQADLLVDAELRGLASHGLLRVPRLIARIVNGVANPSAVGAHEWTGDALLKVDGLNGLGPVVATRALDAVTARARRTGVAVAAIHSANHLGSLGFYVRRVAAEGFACIAFTTSEAIMHPFGGTRGMIGSNPVAIGVPALPSPLVVDFASTVVSMGKVHDHAIRGVPLDSGWALDESGAPTTDPSLASHGSIAPFGGAKGYALGVGVEVLVTALAGSALGRGVTGTLDSTHVANKGDLFIVLQANHAAIIQDYLEDLRRTAPVDLAQPVRVPGDGGDARRRHALEVGMDISSDLWEQIHSPTNRDTPGESGSQ